MKNLFKLKLIGYLYGVQFFLPIISLYFLSHGVTLQNIVISQTLYSIFSFLGEVPTGILADKFGQKLSIIIGYLLEGVGISVMVFIPNIVGLYLAYCLIGIAESFLSGSQESLIYESTKHENLNYQKEYGTFLSNSTTSFCLTTLFTGIMITFFGSSFYPVSIGLTATSFVVAAVIALTLKDYKTEVKDFGPGFKSLEILKQSFQLMKSNKTIFTLLTLTALTLSGEYFLYGVYQPYFEQANVPPLFLGLVLSLGSLLNFVLLKNSYRLENYLSFERITLLLNLPIAFGFIIMALFLNPIFLVGTFIFIKGLFNTQAPIISDYINQYTESHIRTTVISGVSLTTSFFNIIARLILTGVIGIWGVQSGLLIQGMYLFIGTLIAYWIMVKCGCTHKIIRG